MCHSVLPISGSHLALYWHAAAAAAKSLQSCPTLCDPIDGSPPGSPVPGILHARILEWVAISFSNAWKWKVKVKSLSRVWLSATPWTAAHQASPSMGFLQARVLEWGAIAFSVYWHKKVQNTNVRNLPDIGKLSTWKRRWITLNSIWNNIRPWGWDEGW